MRKSWSTGVAVRDVAYIALGSNLGDRQRNLSTARKRIAELPASSIVAESSIEETAPIGPIEQGRYLNQMIALETEMTPAELLAALQQIEIAGGRVRDLRWGPRVIDLDIVTMRVHRSDDDRCRVPHPELQNRDFWRRELDELRALEAE